MPLNDPQPGMVYHVQSEAWGAETFILVDRVQARLDDQGRTQVSLGSRFGRELALHTVGETFDVMEEDGRIVRYVIVDMYQA